MMDNAGSYIRPARDFERLKSERERLSTFSQAPGWPVSFISAEDCARAGFFFLQDGDKVQCAFCRGVAGEWESGDQPISEHRRHFPRCPFVCNLPVGNIPIGQEDEIALQRERDEMLGIDVCGPFAPMIRSASASTEPESSNVRGAQPLNGNMDDLVGLGIKTCGNGPVHTNLVTQPARMKTFTNWPTSTGQLPEAMAEAGFFYIGILDHIKCFYCDGGLRNWEPADDPWREHARWFPSCTFVILNKGDEFIKKVNEDKPPVIPQQYSCKPAGVSREPRRVSDQELRDLIDTPIVQAALEMGMEVGKVKGALQRKIQQTGQPFITTESLLEAILGWNYEYESDPDSDIEEDNDEDERRRPVPRMRISVAGANNRAAFSAQESSSAEASSSSAEHSSGSGDEDMTTESNETIVKTPANRTPSGDSGIAVSNGTSSDEEHHDEKSASNKTSQRKGGEMELEEEVRQLREARQCKICMDNEVGVVFLPCGHLVSCVRCATAVSVCAVCRAQIKAHVRTYFS